MCLVETAERRLDWLSGNSLRDCLGLFLLLGRGDGLLEGDLLQVSLDLLLQLVRPARLIGRNELGHVGLVEHRQSQKQPEIRIKERINPLRDLARFVC